MLPVLLGLVAGMQKYMYTVFYTKVGTSCIISTAESFAVIQIF